LLGRATRRKLDPEILGLALVTGGVLTVVIDKHREALTTEIQGVVGAVRSDLGETLEIITQQFESAHEDTVDLGAKSDRSRRAAEEMGRVIGKGEQRRQNHEERRTLQSMEDDVRGDGGEPR
jgi:hypothetical protein